MTDDKNLMKHFNTAFVKGSKKDGSRFFPNAAGILTNKAFNPVTERAIISVQNDEAAVKRTLEKIKLFEEFQEDAFAALQVKSLETALGEIDGALLATPNLEGTKFSQPNDKSKYKVFILIFFE